MWSRAFSPDLNSDDCFGNCCLYLVNHTVEDIGTFQFVFDQRILLRIGPEIYGIAEVLEFFEMILPAGINLAQINLPDEG